MYEQSGEPLASEVLETLIQLTALARRANQSGNLSEESVAKALLTCLLRLCRAERGTILLCEDRPQLELSEHPSAVRASGSGFRFLALHEMSKEEVAALLVPLSEAGVSDGAPGGTCWWAYRLCLSEERVHDANPRLETLLNVSNCLADQGGTAWLIIGWEDQVGQERASAALIARCAALLPSITNAVEAVISALLLKERMDELERKSVREALEGMELLKAELLDTVSHELRSPLASIKGYAATLLRHEHRIGRDERHQFLLAVIEASDRMEAVVERLLEVSQLETGQFSLQRSSVNVIHLAGEAIAAVQERVVASRPGRFVFRLQSEGADGTPARTVPLVLVDPRRLREVLDNLLENAVTYSPEGGLITVTVRPVDQSFSEAQGEGVARTRGESGQEAVSAPRRMLEICVCDQGQGIPEDHIERIFERFHRVDSSLTRETGGLGLGLTICKRIVELHGGTIWAEYSPQGSGSAFYVRLPIEAGEESKEGSVYYVRQENHHPDC